MKKVKWDFISHQHSELACPSCSGSVVHPEAVELLCGKHRKEFLDWHDDQVKRGYIGSWFTDEHDQILFSNLSADRQIGD